MRIRCLGILAQRTCFDIQHLYTVRVGTYPQLVTIETEGVRVLVRQQVLVRIVLELPFFRTVAHQSAVIAGNPDPTVLILTEP